MSTSRRTIITSIIWKLLEKICVQLITFIVTIILARILSPHDYGLIAIVMVFIILANVIVDGGLNTALIQKKNADQVDFSTIFYTMLLVSSVIYLLLFIIAPFISNFYGNDSLTNILRVLGICVFFYGINSIQVAYVSRNLLFRKLLICSLLSSTISGIIGISLAYAGFGVWALVFYQILQSFISFVALWLIVKWRPTKEFSFNRFSQLFNYGYKLFLTNFITTLFVNIRSLIIGKFFSPSALAFFDRGRQFPSLFVDNINHSVQTVMFPVMSSEQDNTERVKDMVRRSIKMSCFIIFPLICGLFSVSRPLVLVLLTDKWIECIPFVQIFCVAYLLMPMQIANIEAVKSLGYSSTILKLETIKKIIEILILIQSIQYGVQVIAIGVVLYNFICIFINLYPNTKLLNYGVIEQIKDILPSLLCSVGMGAIVYFVQFIPLSSNILILFLQIFLGVISYITLCYISNNESYNYIINILRSKK